jgi:hypothetical protein
MLPPVLLFTIIGDFIEPAPTIIVFMLLVTAPSRRGSRKWTRFAFSSAFVKSTHPDAQPQRKAPNRVAFEQSVVRVCGGPPVH